MAEKGCPHATIHEGDIHCKGVRLPDEMQKEWGLPCKRTDSSIVRLEPAFFSKQIQSVKKICGYFHLNAEEVLEKMQQRKKEIK